jgi:hypothetical protein
MFHRDGVERKCFTTTPLPGVPRAAAYFNYSLNFNAIEVTPA